MIHDAGILYRPIEKWPGVQTADRQRSPFKATWSATRNLLNRELIQLDAKNIVFQVALREQDFRIDGEPRANARATHPGVILSFDCKYGPVQYPCDKYRDFEANVRAIALSLEALRKVDRYGVTKRGEQYTGWKSIGSGFEMPAAKMSRYEAYEVVRKFEGSDRSHDEVVMAQTQNPEQWKAIWREASRRAHPDTGGTTADFQKLQEAKRTLEA